jgi:hypothetical protein
VLGGGLQPWAAASAVYGVLDNAEGDVAQIIVAG